MSSKVWIQSSSSSDATYEPLASPTASAGVIIDDLDATSRPAVATGASLRLTQKIGAGVDLVKRKGGTGPANFRWKIKHLAIHRPFVKCAIRGALHALSVSDEGPKSARRATFLSRPGPQGAAVVDAGRPTGCDPTSLRRVRLRPRQDDGDGSRGSASRVRSRRRRRTPDDWHRPKTLRHEPGHSRHRRGPSRSQRTELMALFAAAERVQATRRSSARAFASALAVLALGAAQVSLVPCTRSPH